jgi:uncharacterized ferredoxin-like protein
LLNKGMDLVAELMAISAHTAPKGHGDDFLTVSVVQGEDLARLIEAMKAWKREWAEVFVRNAVSMEQSDVVVLIGVKTATPAQLNCQACGYPTCGEMPGRTSGTFAGPTCAIRLLDMGIAIGSAVKTASMLNVDTRIMYTVGAVARAIGLSDDDIVMGIPLAATGKNVFFDRS